MLRVLKSIKTTLVIIFISMSIFLTGSFIIPKNLQFFSEINEMPLFKWLSLNEDIKKTFWIYLSILAMAFLSLNMIVCLIDDLLKRLSPVLLIQRLSPHLIHAGVLLVLLGHLISASTGFKKDLSVRRGEEVFLNDMRIKIEAIEFVDLRSEDQSRWRVHLEINSGLHWSTAVAEPARPVFYKYAIYAKSAEPDGRVILGIVHDPGAKWEVAGAIVFVLGAGGLFWSRFRPGNYK